MKPTKHILSKSTFMYGCQCTKRLYLHKFNPSLKNPMDDFQQSIFASGTNVGEIAQELFPGGEDASPPDPFSYHLSVAKTKDLIEKGVTIIYEAAFMHNEVLCAIDILVKVGQTWKGFEVKGSTSVKPPHLLDASLQYYIIKESGIDIEDISIVYLNNKYVRMGELNPQELFSIQSVLIEARNNHELIGDKIQEFKGMIIGHSEPEIEIGDQCFDPYECDFTNHCGAKILLKKKDVAKEIIFEKELVTEFLKEVKYPVYFMDFETIMPAIPEFNNSRPYQQMPFQFSVHVKHTENAELKHSAFLGDGISDARKDFCENLIKVLKDAGSVIVWNQTFEMSRLKELARDFPEFANDLENITKRVIDLMIPFRNKWIDNPSFEGSYSIKNVLPVLVPHLSYTDLEIGDGATAGIVYAQLKNQPADITIRQCEALLKYCELDTLAMVEIFGWINKNC